MSASYDIDSCPVLEVDGEFEPVDSLAATDEEAWAVTEVRVVVVVLVVVVNSFVAVAAVKLDRDR